MGDMRIRHVVIRVGEWRNHHPWNTEAVTKCIDVLWRHMVIEPTEVVPCQNDDCTRPRRTLHHRIDELDRPVLALTNRVAVVFTLRDGCCHPTKRWERIV